MTDAVQPGSSHHHQQPHRAAPPCDAAADADPCATALLATLLRAAVLSARASTTVHPLPSHPRFRDAHGEPDVAALRAALPGLRAAAARSRRAALRQRRRRRRRVADTVAHAGACRKTAPAAVAQVSGALEGSTAERPAERATGDDDDDDAGAALLRAALLGGAADGATDGGAPGAGPAARLERRGAARFSRADCAHGRVAQRFEVCALAPDTDGVDGHEEADGGDDDDDAGVREITAFHGSGVENWYSIIHAGLRVLPGAYASHGRVYGDGVYLAEDFDTAASFAPFATAAEYGGDGDDIDEGGEEEEEEEKGGARGLCIVGEFLVTQPASADAGGLRRRGVKRGDGDGVPDGYVVVSDTRTVRLRALHVLWGGRAGARRGARGAGAAKSGVDWVVVVVLAYMVVLLWMRVA